MNDTFIFVEKTCKAKKSYFKGTEKKREKKTLFCKKARAIFKSIFKDRYTQLLSIVLKEICEIFGKKQTKNEFSLFSVKIAKNPIRIVLNVMDSLYEECTISTRDEY
jgi:hypothetical protein